LDDGLTSIPPQRDFDFRWPGNEPARLALERSWIGGCCRRFHLPGL